MDAIKCAISLRDVTRSPTQNESEREERERDSEREERGAAIFLGWDSDAEWMAMTALRSTPTVGAAVKWDDEGGREGRTEAGG